jgi:hypothetical protein
MRHFLRLLPLFLAASAAAAESRPHNVVLFVADGLRPGMINERTAPAIAALMSKGVVFANSHAVFPTFTMPNAASLATGHFPGDHGDFSNTVFVGKAINAPGQGETMTPFLESDPVLGDVDEHFAGDYLDEETILRAAQKKGYSTSTIGKLGPALIMDHLANTRDKSVPPNSLVIDDSTGRPDGVSLSDAVKAKFAEAGLSAVAPDRGDNKNPGSSRRRPKWRCLCSRKAANPSFSSIGRAIPTARSTIRATAC